tara:strand:+ start:1193 stop:1573 length:381 start_codon:yes stop_codon:yes gene_type:complete
MNKRGQGLVQAETMEYMILIAIAVTLSVMLVTSLSTERYNGVRATDLSLSVNSIFIPKHDITLNYDMGVETREVVFEGREIGTYVEDPIREGKGGLLVDRNYGFTARSLRTSSLGISKRGEDVNIG